MRAAVLSFLGAVAAIEAHRFPEEEPTYYCHPEIEWDSVPPREDDSGAQLERVLVFARHGARMPVHDMMCWVGDETRYTCPTETFYGFTNSPSGGRSPAFTRIRGKEGVLPGDNCVLGQLVDAGVQMHLANGKQFGASYKTALDLDDVPSEPQVMFRSTDVPRVYQSVEAFAMGMFPDIMTEDPSNLEIIIPDSQRDTMTPSAQVCPRLNDALKVFYDSAEAKDRVERSRFERAFMGFVTGRPDDFSTENPEDMEHLYSGLYDCLTSHVCSTVPSEPKNVPLGLGTSSPLFERVEEDATFWLNNRYGTTEELRRLAYGPLIKDVLEDLSIPGRRFSLYLGHDTGPANSLTDTLQLKWMDSGNACAKYWPPFGTALILEIYSDNQARWIYNGRVTSVEAIEECRGKSLCNYESLYEYLTTVVPNKFECKGIPEPTRGGSLRG
ncbi:conserved hypothetical protein [Perkinsus marinus ATCC 50983]|uniref:Prostatic acid phosphatase n=1 Tax=Perkinsus marinus (strain ATCC 50983 / TXsc) TaxID=423536 RepID=C5L8U3_PERM5|nr:conserved hypothetical protein [Perkinsus marinus ATCC 50983]EER06801.1 conserved hypothetical protein [Perkinsus marinus ATCC 50983]|eukprot:XP_002774985.1 conserved hypothetical protein [Perkinsus marinus ATCC 50983]